MQNREKLSFLFLFTQTSRSVEDAEVVDMHTLTRSSCTPSIPPHGHGLLLLNHIVKVGQCALQLPAVDGLRCLAGVLEGDAQVSTARAGGFRRLDVGGCVTDLEERACVSWERCWARGRIES